jgi:hypothetical protein
MTRALLEGPNGTTHLEFRVAKPKPKDKAFVEGAAAKFAERMTKAIVELRSLVEGGDPAIGEAEEPSLRPSAGRFMTEPVTSGAQR